VGADGCLESFNRKGREVRKRRSTTRRTSRFSLRFFFASFAIFAVKISAERKKEQPG
jgi:hypothetical protein